MNEILSSCNFYFRTIAFEKYRHTDNRAGSPQHYVAYMEQGNSKIVAENSTIEIQAGDVFYIPKGLSYQSYWYAENEIRFLSFGFDLFPEGNTKRYVLQKIECGDAVVQQLRNIPTNMPADSGLLGRFYATLANILPFMRYDDHSRRKIVLEKAKNYMYANPDCKISDVAGHCFVSEPALYALFKKEAGITPNTLRQKILCEKAVLLLTTTDRSIQEISDTVGFSSTSYFRKLLLKHIGKSPREIRKAALSI